MEGFTLECSSGKEKEEVVGLWTRLGPGGVRGSQESWTSWLSSPDKEDGDSARVGNRWRSWNLSQPQLCYLQRWARGEDEMSVRGNCVESARAKKSSRQGPGACQQGFILGVMGSHGGVLTKSVAFWKDHLKSSRERAGREAMEAAFVASVWVRREVSLDQAGGGRPPWRVASPQGPTCFLSLCARAATAVHAGGRLGAPAALLRGSL